ncbi:MAG: tyrosine-protein phosphatase [Pseudomonadota bacterium]
MGDSTISDYADRHIPFEGCFNFRDIGGYVGQDGRHVRWGKYYRAGRQDRMTDADLVKVGALGVRAQIDLRKHEEIADQTQGPLEQLGARYHHLPVIPDGRTDELNRLVGDVGISGKRYLGYLEFGPQTWLDLFDIFADAEAHPIVIHCTAGKDRTGVSTAFLLSVLGVHRSVIEADYVLTNRDVARQVDFVENHLGLPEGMDRETMMHHAGVPEDAMSDFLDGLEERWGSAVAYLSHIGVTDAQMEKVRQLFLQDA